MKQNVQKTFFYSLRVEHCTLWYICMLVALNTITYVIMTVIARLNLEESHQYSFRSISAGDAIMT